MIIDMHTHLFPTTIRENRENFFLDEPAFALLYRDPGARMVGSDEMVRAMDEHGVDVSVVFGFPWMNPDTCRRHNDYILESVNRHPDRFVGLCCVNPYTREAEKEVQRSLDNGLSGVGELALYQEGGITEDAVQRIEPIMAQCRQKNLPVLFHTNEPVGHVYPGKSDNTLAQIYNLVRTYGENTIMLAHWGGGLFFYNLLKKEVRDVLANVYFDTAASPFLYDPQIYRVAMELAGEEKILFGTDYPLIPPSRYYKEIEAAGISAAAREKLLGGNAARVLSIPNE
ncbi:MAG: amidohydrolase family protein [Desulfobacterales bacterium]|nr:amidohydrolase family protein [Desulfobacterales bacterium]MBS3756124.1 amidohydrolase family protein [Desulfobacterales bacterium]